jgi:signal peptidase
MEDAGTLRRAVAGWRGLLQIDLPVSAQLVSRVALVVAAISFAVVLSAGIPVLFGYDSFVVTGGSMSPAIREGALLIAKRTNPADIHPGDVITFRRADRPQIAITHRVVGVRHAEDGTPIFRTKGDANATADPQEVSADLPISRMAYTIPYAGYLLEFASTLPGKFLLVLLPALGLVVLTLDAARRSVESRALETVQERRRRGATRRLARDLPTPAPSAMARGRRGGSPSAATAALAGLRRRLSAVAAWRPARTEARRVRAPRAAVRAVQPTAPARPRPVAQADTEGAPAWVDRVASALSRQMATLEQIRDQVLDETGPVARLLAEHDEVVELLTENIERKLSPLVEYADNLEADVDDLKARLGEENAEEITAPLRPYFEEQRRRVVETRAQVERLRRPFNEYVRAQEQAIEAMFAPFDGEVRALEDGLTEQVRLLKRVLTGIRSDQFETAVDFVDGRLGDLRALAEAGASDPASLAGSLQVPLGRTAELKRESLYLGPVLEALGAADARAIAARVQDRVITDIATPDPAARAEPNVA